MGIRAWPEYSTKEPLQCNGMLRRGHLIINLFGLTMLFCLLSSSGTLFWVQGPQIGVC